MKLLTHNMLRCNKKGVEKGYPLKVEAEEIEVEETEFNSEFVASMLYRLDWAGFLSAAADIDSERASHLPRRLDTDSSTGEGDQTADAPKNEGNSVSSSSTTEEPDILEKYLEDEEFLKEVNYFLLEVEIKQGYLVCPESGRKFPIENGIPNMLLKEDEM